MRGNWVDPAGVDSPVKFEMAQAMLIASPIAIVECVTFSQEIEGADA